MYFSAPHSNPQILQLYSLHQSMFYSCIDACWIVSVFFSWIAPFTRVFMHKSVNTTLCLVMCMHTCKQSCSYSSASSHVCIHSNVHAVCANILDIFRHSHIHKCFTKHILMIKYAKQPEKDLRVPQHQLWILPARPKQKGPERPHSHQGMQFGSMRWKTWSGQLQHLNLW